MPLALCCAPAFLGQGLTPACCLFAEGGALRVQGSAWAQPSLLHAQVPYDDLRYLVGEIMYGGHITDDWDRRLCRTYLEEFIKPEMLEGELCLAPGFPLPGNMDYNGYHQVSSLFVCWHYLYM